jgi:hypothetical protein
MVTIRKIAAAVSGLSTGCGFGPVVGGPVVDGPVVDGPVVDGPVVDGTAVSLAHA